MKILLSACLSILCAFSSFSQGVEKDVIAKRIKSIDTYNSEEFVVSVSDITLFKDHIVMLDEKLGKVIVANKELTDMKIFGVKGGGPEEFLSPYLLINDKEENTLYVYDNQKFKIWPIDIDERAVGKGFPFKSMLFNQTVALEDGMLYFTSVSSPAVDVLKYRLKDRKQLGGIDLHKGSVKSFLGRFIFSSNGRFVVVSPYDGLVIDTYDENWELLNTEDLTSLPIIAKRLNIKQPSGLSISGGGKEKIKVTSGKSTMSSARLYGNDLYLLVYSRDKDLKSRANVLLKYTYENGQWQPSRRILLPQEGSYKTFAMLLETDQLVAFDRENGTIDLFEIKG